MSFVNIKMKRCEFDLLLILEILTTVKWPNDNKRKSNSIINSLPNKSPKTVSAGISQTNMGSISNDNSL